MIQRTASRSRSWFVLSIQKWQRCIRRVKDRMLGIDYSSKNIFHERRKGDTDVQVSCISEKLCETGVTNEISQAAPIISKWKGESNDLNSFVRTEMAMRKGEWRCVPWQNAGWLKQQEGDSPPNSLARKVPRWQKAVAGIKKHRLYNK